LTGGEIIVQTLIEQRVGTVFGLPGALNAHLYDALRKHEGALRHVLVRHELGGAWMADGYARAGGDVGVLLTVPGPGVSHAASGVAGAYTDCSRLLLVSARSESGWRAELRRDLFHGLDQQRLLAPVTKWQASVERAGEIAPLLAEAFRRLRSGRPGPAHVEVPADVLGREGGSEIPGFVEPCRRAPAPEEVAGAVAALASARRPLLLAGDGVIHSEASEALGNLAQALGAPVISTIQGKGALPDAHPCSLGDMNSAAGSAAYGLADQVLAVGVRFVQTDTRWPWFKPPPRLLHVDADPREIGRVFAPELGLCADPRLALEAMSACLREAGGRPGSGWAEELPALKRRSNEREVLPLLAALRRALPPGGLAAFDVCYPGFRSRMDWTCDAVRGYHYPGVYVGMGFGLPVGIGARLARPESPTLVVAGDAGFQMTMAELGTAIQHDVAVVVVVVNDGGLTLIRNVQDRDFGGRRYAVDLVNPDFAALAAAYGLPARQVRTLEELESAAHEAFAAGRLALIEYQAA
jgi:acetolactate synthase-1/2/3 large subunit